MARSTTHMEGLVSQEAGSRERPGRCESDEPDFNAAMHPSALCDTVELNMGHPCQTTIP